MLPSRGWVMDGDTMCVSQDVPKVGGRVMVDPDYGIYTYRCIKGPNPPQHPQPTQEPPPPTPRRAQLLLERSRYKCMSLGSR